MTSLLSPPPTVQTFQTVADLQERLGGVPEERIRLQPLVGSATVKDVVEVAAREGRLCELVEGVLVEKAMGAREALLAFWIARLLDDFARPRDLGLVIAAGGPLQIVTGLVRIPDVSFLHWDRIPGGQVPEEPVPGIVPNLAVEVLSRSNTRGEMRVKRGEYFRAGVELVWEVDPRHRTVAVYTAPDNPTVLAETESLTGGAVLAGFTLPLATLFGEIDRRRRDRRTESE